MHSAIIVIMNIGLQWTSSVDKRESHAAFEPCCTNLAGCHICCGVFSMHLISPTTVEMSAKICLGNTVFFSSIFMGFSSPPCYDFLLSEEGLWEHLQEVWFNWRIWSYKYMQFLNYIYETNVFFSTSQSIKW